MSRFVVLVLVGCAVPPSEGTTPAPPDIPCMALDEAALSFGEVPLGELVPTKTLTIANPCGAALELTDLQLVDELQTGVFSILGGPELPLTVEAGGEARITVQAEPDWYGRYYAVLEIETTDPRSPFESASLLLDSVCESLAADSDSDGDAVPDACDVCEGFADDGRDEDGDGIPDQCDACMGFDDAYDADGDTVPDDCDLCPGHDDRLDDDEDGIPDGCDV